MIATDPGGDQPVGIGEIGALEEQALIDANQEGTDDRPSLPLGVLAL